MGIHSLNFFLIVFLSDARYGINLLPPFEFGTQKVPLVMKHILALLMILCFRSTNLFGQEFSTRDLVNLSKMTQVGIKKYMGRKGFEISYDYPDGDSVISYNMKDRGHIGEAASKMMVDFYENLHSRYFILKHLNHESYLTNLRYLEHSGFSFDREQDSIEVSSLIFQKDNLSMVALINTKDSLYQYGFELRQRRLPDSLKYAEDLLQFDSHEFLRSYFGKRNVNGDLYFFTENQLRKCSVLFGGTDYQAAFVWGDERNLNKLSYIIISNVIPTKGGQHSGVPDGNNAWNFRSKIQVGMLLEELIKLNGKDFLIYGDKSNYPFMVRPDNKGKIDFRKTAVMLTCNNCYDNDIFNKVSVSATEVLKAHLNLKVFDIILYP